MTAAVYATVPTWFLWTAVIVGCLYLAAICIGSAVGEWSAAVRRREADALEGTPVYDELAADHPALGAIAAAEAARLDEEWARIVRNGWVRR